MRDSPQKFDTDTVVVPLRGGSPFVVQDVIEVSSFTGPLYRYYISPEEGCWAEEELMLWEGDNHGTRSTPEETG